ERPRRRIRPDEEDRAAEKCRRDQQALVRAERESKAMRHDEPDEADDAAHRDRRADGQRRGEEARATNPGDVGAELRGRLLSEGQKIQAPYLSPQYDRGDETEERDDRDE